MDVMQLYASYIYGLERRGAFMETDFLGFLNRIGFLFRFSSLISRLVVRGTINRQFCAAV